MVLPNCRKLFPVVFLLGRGAARMLRRGFRGVSVVWFLTECVSEQNSAEFLTKPSRGRMRPALLLLCRGSDLKTDTPGASGARGRWHGGLSLPATICRAYQVKHGGCAGLIKSRSAVLTHFSALAGEFSAVAPNKHGWDETSLLIFY